MDIKFYKRLIELKKEKNLSQSELADALNVSKNTVYCWEKGKRLPNIKKIILIAKYFNVKCNYILGLDDFNKI